ncbi:MAG: RNA methyltransferase [Cellulosilyticum sp.]|nr:RNA methyltransferase [Cellulosilyticum sp.]
MNKKYITSTQNATIKLAKELLKKKAARKKHGLFVIEGIRAVKEIPVQASIETLLVSETVDEAIYEDMEVKEALIIPESLFQTISETTTPQGIMAIVKKVDRSLDELTMQEGAYLLLENLQDPGNLGTIIRTAHAFNFKGIFMTKGCVDLYSPKVVRSTMSSLFYMPIVMDGEIEDYMTYLKDRDYIIYTTALRAEAKWTYDLNFEKNMVLVIGNEGNGVSEYCLEHTDYTMMIPMPGGAESLNASVATAVCMYEVIRQRRK